MKALFANRPKWIVVICLGLMPIQRGAAQFVEIRAELEVIGYSLRDTNTQARTKPRTISSVCITGANKWRIEDDFVQGGEDKWFFDGTNVYNRLLNTIYIWPSRDGLPLGGTAENMPWLAFCSGAYLKREGRIIPLPLEASLRHTRDRFGYTDKTTTFDDELGLPRTVDLFTSRSLYQASEDDFDREAFFGNRYTKWTKKTAASLREGVLTFHYAVTESTNFHGRNFPTEFEFFQNPRPYEQNGDWFFSGKGRVKSIRASTEPKGVFQPGMWQTIVDGRFRDAANQVYSIIYTTTNGFASPTNDPFLQEEFKASLKEVAEFPRDQAEQK